MSKIATLNNLKFLDQSKIALCHGVFDVLHEGHIAYLEEAKKLAPILVVSITPDQFVNKGPGRPRFNHQQRARMLASLEVVNYVTINDQPRATNVIHALRPAFYVKGPDYKNRESDVTQGILEEEEAVNSVGGKIVFTETSVHSSSELINRYFNSFSEEQNQSIARVKELGGLNTVNELLHEMEKLKVTVVGEPIVDTYIFCVPEGISSKSPTVSARFLSEENYAGGSLAVANHLADFVESVSLFAPHAGEVFFQDIKRHLVDKRVLYHDSLYYKYTTPRKTRYIDQDKTQRMFEFTNINQHIWKENEHAGFTQAILTNVRESDLLMVCDFGHGVFENGFLSGLDDIEVFKAVNCQTNSSNFGFNPFTKHKRFDYLSLDLREARVAFHDIYSDANHIFNRIDKNVSMTLGANGALFKNGGEVIKCPAFSDKVIDAIGAGDAYYAMTSLLVRVGAPAEMIPFLGNIFAGLKTKIIGNKFSVKKSDFIKAVTAILK